MLLPAGRLDCRTAQLFERFLRPEDFSVRTGTELSWILDVLRITCRTVPEECDSGSGSGVALVWTRDENEGAAAAGSAGTEPPHLPSSPEPAAGAVWSRRTRRAGSREAP